MALAESTSVVLTANQDTPATQNAAPKDASTANLPTISKEKNWYFSWGYSRQWYEASDIHVTQPSQGSNFTVHQVKASDLATTFPEGLSSTLNMNFFNPQENIRLGKYMDPEKTFAIEFSLDHSKYNTNLGQTAHVTGTFKNQPINTYWVLNKDTFDYVHHNGLNHIMLNAVWLHHLYGPKQKAGDLESISRIGAGFLLPHSENTIDGNTNQVGPKWGQNSCCFGRNDWWQLLGWTAGVEVGLRYRVYESMYLELTAKEAYGVLSRVPVYQGSADQELWMTEAVLSAGFVF
ncbi:MAG: hypothetical protein WCI39_09755 [Gallionellaceae bacterium]